MPNCSDSLRSGRAARCAVCDGKFGLVRHYSWRTPLCSKKCVECFRARRESDRNWVGWLQIAFDQRQRTACQWRAKKACACLIFKRRNEAATDRSAARRGSSR